jgi:hypothetical protein
MNPLLLQFPLEVITNITDRLALQDKVCLAMTNRHLRFMIKPPTHEEFLQAENTEWAISRQIYTCKGCVGFRPLLHFTDDMRKGKRARRGTEASMRMCIKCGVDLGWYSEGTEVTILGRCAVLVRLCRTFTDHTAAEISCGSIGVLWIKGRTRETQQYLNNYQLFEDDWTHCMHYLVQGRHAEEVVGCWLDL